jgi:hypothetical protein
MLGGHFNQSFHGRMYSPSRAARANAFGSTGTKQRIVLFIKTFEPLNGFLITGIFADASAGPRPKDVARCQGKFLDQHRLLSDCSVVA